MPEENTDQSKQPDESGSTETAPETQTLEDIAKEFSVDEQITNFTAQPNQQVQQPYQPPSDPGQYVPDPVTDPEGYNRYTQQQQVVTNQVQGTLRELNNRINQFEQQTELAKVDADVQKAVVHVNQKLGVDPELAEIALEKAYRNDPSFQRIWNNRDKNPAAFKKALDVVADKYQTLFNIQTDPQLVENQRAAKASQKTMATTAKEHADDKWENLSDAEFEQQWSAVRQSGG